MATPTHVQQLALLMTELVRLRGNGVHVTETPRFEEWRADVSRRLRQCNAPRADEFDALEFRVRGVSLGSEHVEENHGVAFEQDMNRAEQILSETIARSNLRRQVDNWSVWLPQFSNWLASVVGPIASSVIGPIERICGRDGGGDGERG
jgi:hypothetical protein